MRLEPFLLEKWLERKFQPHPPIRFDLASSTGPVWSLRQLLSVAGPDELEPLLDTSLVYSSAAGSDELREAIAEFAGGRSEQVQVVTGASEALLILFFLAAEPGANVVLPFPNFPTTDAVCRGLGLEVRHYRLRRESGFALYPGEVEPLIDAHTRLVLVTSPGNPCGNVVPLDVMRRLHDLCAGRSIPFVCDQVYHPAYQGAAQPWVTVLPRATVIGDLSKALCLSGLRVGWIIEPDRARRDRYLDARSYFTISSTPLGERLAVLALRHRSAILERARKVAEANLRLLDEFFVRHRESLSWVKPAGGFTAFPWLTNGSDARAFCEQAAALGVLIAPGDCFGMPAHFRLGFGAAGESFRQALEVLSEVPRIALAS